MLGTGECSKLALELANLGPHYVLPVIENATDGTVDLASNSILLRLEIDEFN
jgi:hypothetical protein